jgi:hypothetical protein
MEVYVVVRCWEIEKFIHIIIILFIILWYFIVLYLYLYYVL